MKINRNNYEEFFLGWLDGTLSAENVRELEVFLLANPDLKDELEGLDSVVLSPESISFSGKQNLKKTDLSLPVTDENFDDFCAAASEGDLSRQQLTALDQYLQEKPERKKDRAVYDKLQLVPDPSIVFPDRTSLRKSVLLAHRYEIILSFAIAASIAILISVYPRLLRKEVPTVAPVVALNQESVRDTDTSTVSAAKPGPALPKKTSDDDSLAPDKENQNTSPNPERSSRKGISFKVSLPVASAEKSGVEKAESLKPEQIMQNVKIDPQRINQASLAILHNEPDQFKPVRIDLPVKSRKFPAPKQEFLSVEAFAKEKFSTLVFGENSREELTVWNVVTAGIDKVNDLTGSDMKLEKDQNGETSVIKFNSRLLKVSTPLGK